MITGLHHKQIRRIASRTVLGPLLMASALLGITLRDASAGPNGYTFTPIAFLSDSAPGGGAFNNDFEPTALNNRGELAFTADLIVPGQEGIFLAQGLALTQLVRFGQTAPGGGVFDVSEMGVLGLNDEGNVAFGFTLEPVQLFFLPDGVVAAYGGIFRYSHTTQNITPVVLPGSPAPGGGTFLGVGFDTSMNNQGAIAFSGVVGTAANPAGGAFLADKAGNITSIASPGAPAPNGDTWTIAFGPRLNDAGDIVFAGDVSTATLGPSIYLRKANNGQIVTIAKAGDPAPGGGVLQANFLPRINSVGDVAFLGILVQGTATTQPVSGVYLHTGKTLLRVAGPGDAMPGGGHVSFIAALQFNVGMNNRGEVAFCTALDTGEEGLYVYSHGSVRLLAKTGTVIPGVGTIFSLEMGNSAIPGIPPVASGVPSSGTPLNDLGQTFFGCSLADGRGALLLATPSP